MPPPRQRHDSSTATGLTHTPPKASQKKLPSQTPSSVSPADSKRAARSSIAPHAAPQEQPIAEVKITEDGTVLLVDDGDLILDIQHTLQPVVTKQSNDTTERLLVRVHTHLLTKHSTYFATLLSPATSFAEGARVSKQLAVLKSQYPAPGTAPPSELPRIKIDYVGQISQVTSIKPLMMDFLRLIQGLRLDGGKQAGSKGLKMPIKNIANLAIVADRFGAAEVVGKWVAHNIPPPGQERSADMNEEQVRMRLSIGVLLDLDAWVSIYSLQLIVLGSPRWSPYAAEPAETDPLWLTIPRGVEEELPLRRTRTLQTFASLQSYMLGLYASKKRNCWLGYDSSPQCDSFQLGEFIKFLARNGLLDLGASILGAGTVEAERQQTDDEGYQGDIRTLLATFRKCPAYQLDSNHGHCGPKKELMAGLDIITSNISNAGICWHCWQNGSAGHRWVSAKPPLLFDKKTAGKPGIASLKADGSRCLKEVEHAYARDFFLAKDKGWENLIDRRTSAELGTRLSSQGWILKHPDLLLSGLQRAGA